MAVATRARNVFVLGLDDYNRELLERLPGADGLRFWPLLDTNKLVRADRFDVPALLAEARRELERTAVPVDALVGYWDFPTTLMLPILRAEYGLPGPELESLLRCEHKFWARLCQNDVIPDQIPPFRLFDPFADDPLGDIGLPFPFWIKPVKSHSSYLGFAIHGPSDMEHAIGAIRENIGRFGEPFEHIVEHADLPDEVAHVRGHHCLAEEMISTNWQCTLEGWVHRGEVAIYGVVDSVREGAENSSFSRYQYPSHLPERAQRRMAESVRRLVPRLGLDSTPFNAEFFYDEVLDRIWFLEMNARVSKSHGPLFERVDGSSNLNVMVASGLGERPYMPRDQGPERTAAKFMVRLYQDGIVTRAPSTDEVAALSREMPGVDIQIHVREGMRLSDLPNQDSYTYEVATLFIGAEDEAELLAKYHRCLECLPFEIQDADPSHPEATVSA